MSVIGLDYTALEKVANIFEFELTPYSMVLIQEIEKYYLRKGNDGVEQSNS